MRASGDLRSRQRHGHIRSGSAIWARVSTDRQHEDNQIRDLERLCEHRGWEITRRYEIADASAYKGEHRQALRRAHDAACASATRAEVNLRWAPAG